MEHRKITMDLIHNMVDCPSLLEQFHFLVLCKKNRQPYVLYQPGQVNLRIKLIFQQCVKTLIKSVLSVI